MRSMKLKPEPSDRFIKVTKLVDPDDIVEKLMDGGIVCRGRAIYYEFDVVVEYLEIGEIVSPADQIKPCTEKEAIEKIHEYLRGLGLPYHRFFFKPEEHLRLREPVVTPKNL